MLRHILHRDKLKNRFGENLASSFFTLFSSEMPPAIQLPFRQTTTDRFPIHAQILNQFERTGAQKPCVHGRHAGVGYGIPSGIDYSARISTCWNGSPVRWRLILMVTFKSSLFKKLISRSWLKR